MPRRAFADGPLHLCTRGFEELPVFNAGRADGLTGPAIQAFRHLMHEAGAGQIEMPFRDRLNEGDASARTRCLNQRLDIGRTGGQAESAANALVINIARRKVGAGESACG